MKLFNKIDKKKVTQTNVLGRGGNFSCRHPKLWSYIKSNVKAFFITGAITFVVTASATTILHSRQVRYKNDKSVEQALNELYEKAGQIEMKKMGCDGCTKLEYLESTGTQYIDTEFVPNQDTDFEITYIIYNPISKSPSSTGYLFGVRNGSQRNRFQLATWADFTGGMFSVDTLDSSLSTNTYNPEIIPKTKQTIIKQNNTLTSANGTLIQLGTHNFTCDSSLTIFVGKVFWSVNSISYTEYAKMQLYYFKLYNNNNTLVRDYIPVLDKNNRPCLFDKVSKTCFYNQGTGEFLYG